MNILITAGPTREPIDAVRYIGNRSSGKVGISLALAAYKNEHNVTLLMGPGIQLPEMPSQISILRFESTADLQSLLSVHFPNCDILIMAAAVADYTPLEKHDGKLPRSHDQGDSMIIELTPTPDLAAALAPQKKPNQQIIAFALEEADVLIERATAKMKRKKVDAIVANPLGTMEADVITPTLITPSGQTSSPGELRKAEFASWLIKQIHNL
ncbi:Coenzyme A biosynthesis bifunctional protein CoaBC [Poriferisphaera corsica]|uniref:Coenzyme A biosynthesis bifunctional protein CoaBC n=1 Tax=Poriferisphaera corsica TaxID=2528020 RepID=A0A517YPG2_9BACT|nr:phosphopantothenoylcysteine decarboxylase [Poriferisphaera corsica]QDU32110.1 Coenzyme A biosynthesis bifunctional protein CoaBC [Poriferisphaera corsica]